MRIVIWGTGKYGRNLLRYLNTINALLKDQNLPQINCVYFLDNAVCSTTTSLEEIPICRPDEFVTDNVDAIVVAASKYEEILEQIKGMQILFPPVIVYHPKRKIKFLHDLDKFFGDIDFFALSCDYCRKLQLLERVLCLQREQEIDIWETLIGEEWREEEIAAALEEAGDSSFNERLYRKVSSYRSNGEGCNQCIGIYYPRFYNGGVERVIAQIMPMFLKMGFQVVLITEEIDVEQEYHCSKDVVRVCLPNDELDRYEWFLTLGNLIKQYGIGWMHLHDFSSYTIETMAVYYLRRKKISTMIHIHRFYREINGTRLLLEPYRMTNRVIVLSREDEHFWRRNGVLATYIPNPVNCDIPYLYHVKKSEHPIITWIGRIEQTQKQIYDVVPIMQELVKIIPNTLLRIIGKADSVKVMEELLRRIQKADLEKHIEFLGFLDKPWEECSDADVLLMTSAYEGFPMVLMESRMMGLPVVLYRLPYLELLKDGKGYLEVSQNDTVGVAEKLALIIKDRDLQMRLSRDARKSIEEFAKLDIEGMWKEVLLSR